MEVKQENNLIQQLLKARQRSLQSEINSTPPYLANYEIRKHELDQVHADQILNPHERNRVSRAIASLNSHVPIEYHSDDILGNTLMLKNIWTALSQKNIQDKHRALLFIALKDMMDSVLVFLDSAIHLEDSPAKNRIIKSLSQDSFDTGRNRIAVRYDRDLDLLDISLTDRDGVTLHLQTHEQTQSWLLEDQMQDSLAVSVKNIEAAPDYDRDNWFILQLYKLGADQAELLDIVTKELVQYKSLCKAITNNLNVLKGGKIFEFFQSRYEP